MNDYSSPPRTCIICLDKKGKVSSQYCRQNYKHPNYEFDSEDMLEYLDCLNFIKQNKKSQNKNR